VLWKIVTWIPHPIAGSRLLYQAATRPMEHIALHSEYLKIHWSLVLTLGGCFMKQRVVLSTQCQWTSRAFTKMLSESQNKPYGQSLRCGETIPSITMVFGIPVFQIPVLICKDQWQNIIPPSLTLFFKLFPDKINKCNCKLWKWQNFTEF
jgi:hypothetical protein